MPLAHWRPSAREVDHDFLIGANHALVGAEECTNIVAALRWGGTPAREALWQRTNEEKDPAARARLASTLLHLDDTRGARLCWPTAPIPSIGPPSSMGTSPGMAISASSPICCASEDPEFGSGTCAALGRLDPATVLPEVRRGAPEGPP